MSILSSLYHNEIHNKPNEVHNIPEENANKQKNCTDGNATLTPDAKKRLQALEDGNLRPALFYTQQEQTPCPEGVWESSHTVASKLESKEEYPQG